MTEIHEEATVATRIRGLSPCAKALTWAAAYPDTEAGRKRAWAECPRGDWMLWLLGTQAGPPESERRKRLVLAACGCARLALRRATDARVLACIVAAEKWARGEATMADLREARSACAAAIACAAVAVVAAAAVADGAAAVADGAAADARTECMARFPNIVREHYPDPPTLEAQ